jgi:hypothetical protein
MLLNNYKYILWVGFGPGEPEAKVEPIVNEKNAARVEQCLKMFNITKKPFWVT